METVRIAIIGDYDPNSVPHVKTDSALAQMRQCWNGSPW